MGQRISKEQKKELAKLLEGIQLQTKDCEFTAAAFSNFCRMHRSTLDVEDFKHFLKMMNLQHYNDALVRAVFHVLDSNGDGQLDLMEFTRYFVLLSRYPLHCKVHMIFDIIDRDGSGSIDREEMRNFYNDLAHFREYLMDGSGQLPCGGIKNLFDEMDKNGDNVINRDEFSKYVEVNGPVLMGLLDAFVDLSDAAAPASANSAARDS